MVSSRKRQQLLSNSTLLYYNQDMEQINKTILDIAKALLKEAGPAGISKVKLAKMIYFTHKELCKKGVLALDSIQYIRMPLGPVPCGFKDLKNCTFIEVKEEPLAGGLFYNREVYTLKGLLDENTVELSRAVRSIFKRLNNMTTSALVEESHNDPSWKSHTNGSEYYIRQEDLDACDSKKIDSVSDYGVSDSQKLQALLLEGMLEDVVRESTRLEYPHYGDDPISK